MSRRGIRLIVAGLMCALCGCATIEYKKAPEAPEVRMIPKLPAEQLPSPLDLHPDVVKPEPPKEAPPPIDLLKISIDDAVALALDNNQGLQVQKIDPASVQTLIAEQRAVFDPEVSAFVTGSRQRLERDTIVPKKLTVIDAEGKVVPIGTVQQRVESGVKTESVRGSVGIDQLFPTGTGISATFSPSHTRLDNFATPHSFDTRTDTDVDTTTAELSFTQHILRGAGLKVNLAGLRQAKLAALSSDYQLRGFVENLVAEIEFTYWDYTLAKRQIQILEESLALAEDQAIEIEERIRVGVLAETERAAADAEVAQRRSSLIDGRSALAQLRLDLLRLLNPSPESMRIQDIELTSEPVTPEVDMSKVEESIAFAYRMRPELNQTRLQIISNDLDLVKTKNGLLPQLDLFLDFSKDLTETEYAIVLRESSRDLEDDAWRVDVGAQFSYPIGNRAARARYQRAQFAREKSDEALANLTQLVEQDVRGAYVELARSQEQIAATAATRRLQEVVEQTEREKFRIGTSTGFLVAQAQRDLLITQINEVQAVKNFLKALVNLYRLDGSLLLRRGIICPGAEPVSL